MEDDSFGRRIRPHDRYQFEIKLDYKFSKDRKRHRYMVEAFFFLPYSLDLQSDNYNYNDFYKDVQNYIRFKTPVMSFEYLEDLASKDSPLIRMQQLIKKLLRHYTPEKEEAFIYESKLLACIFRSTFRENILLIFDEISRLSRLESPSLLGRELQGLLTQFSEKFRKITTFYRSFNKDLLSAGMENVRRIYRLMDEFLSLTIENYHYYLLEEIEKIPHEEIRQDLFRIARDIILQEEDYQKQKGYLSIINPQDPVNELFLHRQGLLKKFASGILYLELAKKNTQKRWNNFFFGIAAGLAMLFATLVGFYAQKYLPDFSMGLLVAFVIIYMFKDRMKDLFKEIFSDYVSRKFYDRRIEILDPGQDRKVGFCKEKFHYFSFEELDKEVQELRKLNTLPALKVEERNESIFCYKRYIEIFSGPVSKYHSRIAGLNDIIRFNVKNMLTKMDEPIQEIPFVYPDSTQVSKLAVAKIYHLNVVFRFTLQGDDSEVHYERLRAVLDQRGIQRVEKISQQGEANKVK